MNAERVSEAEIVAYLDNELDLERRFAVEDHLARNPDAAACLMAEMRTRSALKLLSMGEGTIPGALHATGALLADSLNVKRRFRFTRSIGALAAVFPLLVLISFAIGTSFREHPSYVEDAVTSYKTGLLRATMASQIETPTLDANEIRQTTRISVPPLPTGWTITDVQVFPSDEGPSVQIMIEADGHQQISLFAVHASSSAPPSPMAVRYGGTSVAFWQADGVSYALIGTESPEALDRSAETLAAQAVPTASPSPPAAAVKRNG